MQPTVWQHLETFLRHLVPLLTSLALAVITVVPSDVAGMVRIGPLLVLTAVYYWSVHRPDLIGYGQVFLLGVAEDLLGGGPFGVATLTDLLVAAFVFSQGRFFQGKPFLVKWATFVPLAAVVVVIRLLIVSVLALRLLDGSSAFYAFLMTIAFYPVVAWLLGRLHIVFLRDA